MWDIICFSPQGHKSVAAWFHLTGTTVTLCSTETVKQGTLLSWKIETWLPNCGVIHRGKVDHLSQLPVFFPLTSDVHTYQILPQRLPGWKTGMWRVGDIRMNWPIVMSYNLRHGSLSTESRRFNVSEVTIRDGWNVEYQR